MSEALKPETLPWRSVYPAGSKENCAAVSAGDHYVYLNIFADDDRKAGTVAMHQEYAALIVTAVNSHDALVEALNLMYTTMICQNYKKHIEVVEAALKLAGK